MTMAPAALQLVQVGKYGRAQPDETAAASGRAGLLPHPGPGRADGSGAYTGWPRAAPSRHADSNYALFSRLYLFPNSPSIKLEISLYSDYLRCVWELWLAAPCLLRSRVNWGALTGDRKRGCSPVKGQVASSLPPKFQREGGSAFDS